MTVIGLGFGGGLRGTETIRVRSADVEHDGRFATVRVGEPYPRVVPMRPPYAEQVLKIARSLDADEFLLGRDPDDGRQEVSRIIRSSRGFPAVTAGRLRATWLYELMAERVPLPEILRAAGGIGGRDLVNIAHSVEPLDEQSYFALITTCATRTVGDDQ